MRSEQIIRPKEVASLTGLSRATLWRMQKIGEFPKAKKIGRHAVGFLWSEIEAWIKSLK